MQHHAGITAHFHPFSAQGNDSRNAGSNTVYVDSDVAPTLSDGVENSNTGIDIATNGIDPDIQVLIAAVHVHQFVHDVTAGYFAVSAFVTDFSVEQQAGSLFVQYGFKKNHISAFRI